MQLSLREHQTLGSAHAQLYPGIIWPKKLGLDKLYSALLEMPKHISSEHSWDLGRNQVVGVTQLSQTAAYQVSREGGPTTQGVLPLFLWCDHNENEATAHISFLKFV